MKAGKLDFILFVSLLNPILVNSQIEHNTDTLFCVFNDYDDYLNKDALLSKSYLVGDSLLFYKPKAVSHPLIFSQARDTGNPIVSGNSYCIFKIKDEKKIAEGYWSFEVFYGYVREYFTNGETKSEGFYIGGLKDQLWKYYSDSGVLIKEELFRTGELISSKSY